MFSRTRRNPTGTVLRAMLISAMHWEMNFLQLRASSVITPHRSSKFTIPKGIIISHYFFIMYANRINALKHTSNVVCGRFIRATLVWSTTNFPIPLISSPKFPKSQNFIMITHITEKRKHRHVSELRHSECHHRRRFNGVLSIIAGAWEIGCCLVVWGVSKNIT